jgi:hypothetical protein
LLTEPGLEVMLSTLSFYNAVAQNFDRVLEATSQEPAVKRESAYYLANIQNAKSLDDFVHDQRLFAFAMKAFGFADMLYAKAFMRKVLSEGIDRRDSLANRLADPRFREFAATFNFVRYGQATTVFDRTRAEIVDRYLRQSLEENAGRQNEGVRLALYFARRAPGVSSAYGILADRSLLKVVQLALNIPAETGKMDIDKQARMIADRLKIEDLKNPTKLKTFIQRFTTLWETENRQTTQLPANLQISTSQVTITPDVLAKIQSLQGASA